MYVSGHGKRKVLAIPQQDAAELRCRGCRAAARAALLAATARRAWPAAHMAAGPAGSMAAAKSILCCSRAATHFIARRLFLLVLHLQLMEHLLRGLLLCAACLYVHIQETGVRAPGRSAHRPCPDPEHLFGLGGLRADKVVLRRRQAQ